MVWSLWVGIWRYDWILRLRFFIDLIEGLGILCGPGYVFCAYHVHNFWGKVYRPTILPISIGEVSPMFYGGFV